MSLFRSGNASLEVHTLSATHHPRAVASTRELLTASGRLANEAHNTEGSHQRNAGLRSRQKVPHCWPTPSGEGSGPPRCLTQRCSQSRYNRVGWAQHCGTQRYRDPISIEAWKPPRGMEFRSKAQNTVTGTSLEVQPASGSRVCAKSQKPRPPVYRLQEHHSIRVVCNSALSGIDAGFARVGPTPRNREVLGNRVLRHGSNI